MAKLAILFLTCFKMAFFGFGGGLAMLPLLMQSVQKFGLVNQDEFLNLVVISQVTPGPVIVNGSTYVGFLYAGIPGGIIATVGVVLPSFFLVLLVMHFLDKHNESPLVQGFFAGIRPATVGLVAAAVVLLADGSVVMTGSAMIIPCILCVISFILSVWKKVNPIALILISAVIGILFCR